MSRLSVRLFVVLALTLLAGTAQAATHVWPGPAPCGGSLQNCINGVADGDRIEVQTTTIHENINLYDMNRTLVAADGYHPAFTAGHWLSISSAAISGDRAVTVRGFSFTDGYIDASYSGTGTGTYDIGKMTLTRASSNLDNYIQVQAIAGTLNVNVHENRIYAVPRNTAEGLITLRANGGALNARAYYNHLVGASTTLMPGAGILSDFVQAGSSVVTYLHGNEVRGDYAYGSIIASTSSGLTGTVGTVTFNNVVIGADQPNAYGIRMLAGSGTLKTLTIANTITRTVHGIDLGPHSGADPAARITGTVSSNLIRAVAGLAVDTTVAPALTNDYNLINATANYAVLGVHTITSDAELISDDNPRLRGNSPAIDAADTTTVGAAILINGMPFQDADGLRRVKTWFSPNKIDIGAYEYGDATFLHSSASTNIVANWTTIDNPATNGDPAANLFVTPNYTGDGSYPRVIFDHPHGVWYTDSRWTIFDENPALPMPANTNFDVFVPAPGEGVFRHVATSTNSSGWHTTLDDPSVNDSPDKILLVTQNYSAGGVYNAHPVGVSYLAISGPGSWLIWDTDQSVDDLPYGAGFNVYAQDPSPNVFRVTATINNSAGNLLALDHPLLNDALCARPVVTPVYDGTAVTGNVFLQYIGDTWYITDNGMHLGAQFNVLVDPGQVAACRDVIFANGFD